MMKKPQSQGLVNGQCWESGAERLARRGRCDWERNEPSWLLGLFDDIEGKDIVELGCGTAHLSAWLARAGGRPVGVDNHRESVAVARALQEHHRLRFPLYLSDPEATPFSDASFDLAVSGCDAAPWRISHQWISEAARILRPGGRLVFIDESGLSLRDLTCLLYACGLQVLSISDLTPEIIKNCHQSDESVIRCVVASR